MPTLCVCVDGENNFKIRAVAIFVIFVSQMVLLYTIYNYVNHVPSYRFVAMEVINVLLQTWSTKLGTDSTESPLCSFTYYKTD